MSCNWNESNLRPFTSVNWRARRAGGLASWGASNVSAKDASAEDVSALSAIHIQNNNDIIIIISN